MCGICFVCIPQSRGEKGQISFEEDLLLHRGPDASCKQSLFLPGNRQASMRGCVLHLRGVLTPQPLVDSKENILLWNGEIFDGLKVEEDENDTKVLLNSLEACASIESILQTFQQIQGPWAFIYWQAAHKTLYFGRDKFGRRSLLWHLPENVTDNIVITSVALDEQVYREIPSVGIFSLNFSTVEDSQGSVCSQACTTSPELVVYPWMDCRWPGTSQRVADTTGQELMQHLYPDYHNSSCFDISVRVEENAWLSSWIPMLVSCNVSRQNQHLAGNDNMQEISLSTTENQSQYQSVYQSSLSDCTSNSGNISLSSPSNTDPEKRCDTSDTLGSDKSLEKLLRYIYQERKDLHPLIERCTQALQDSVNTRVTQLTQAKIWSKSASCHSAAESTARVAILFSGGLDSTVLAALADRCLPEGEPIDLLNVSFEQSQPVVPQKQKRRKEKQQRKKGNNHRGADVAGHIPGFYLAEKRDPGFLLTNIKTCNSLCGEANLSLSNDQVRTGSALKTLEEGLNHSSIKDVSKTDNERCDSVSNFLTSDCITSNNEDHAIHSPVDLSPVYGEAEENHAVCESNGNSFDSSSCKKLSHTTENKDVPSVGARVSNGTQRLSQLSHGAESPVFDPFNVPDRQTGRIALSELNPRRKWNFVEINVTKSELEVVRQDRIRRLIYPLRTVLDDSIGCAVWFAARGQGLLFSSDKDQQQQEQQAFTSRAQVLLCGMAADELFAGYSRHRVTFNSRGLSALENEIQEEIWRISSRNLGRDDRIISDHGKEARFPYLDETFVELISQIPLDKRVDFSYPRGIGEKLLLRLCALKLGLAKTACQAKRAIQFGSKIAKLDNKNEKGSDVCDRLS